VTGVARLRALAFAARLAARSSDALGDALVSVILHGSLTLDDFTPGRSDIDVLVVVGEPLSDDQFATLRNAVDQLRGDASSRVDLRVVTRATAAAPTRAPVMEAAFTLRPGKAPDVETRIAEPDLVAEFSIARAHGRSIVGDAPEAVIGPVPDDWLLEIGDRQLAAWEALTDDADHAELMVLTACRIWRFSAERVHCSKAAAGRWALERDPTLGAIEEALRQRTRDPAATIGEEGIARLLAVVRQELRLVPSKRATPRRYRRSPEPARVVSTDAELVRWWSGQAVERAPACCGTGARRACRRGRRPRAARRECPRR
jgi:predicted nucleotidyltransferase